MAGTATGMSQVRLSPGSSSVLLEWALQELPNLYHTRDVLHSIAEGDTLAQ